MKMKSLFGHALVQSIHSSIAVQDNSFKIQFILSQIFCCFLLCFFVCFVKKWNVSGVFSHAFKMLFVNFHSIFKKLFFFNFPLKSLAFIFDSNFFFVNQFQFDFDLQWKKVILKKCC
jgi:hypothetical protein